MAKMLLKRSPNAGLLRMRWDRRQASTPAAEPRAYRPPSAVERATALQRARERSQEAVTAATTQSHVTSHRRTTFSRVVDIPEDDTDTFVSTAPRQVDIRMYEGLAASRNRLSRKVAELQRKTSALEAAVAAKDAALVEAMDNLTRALCEYNSLCRLAEGAAAGVQFGVDQEDALRKLVALQERIEFMYEKLQEGRQALSMSIVRQVPVVWAGLASEVRLRGDFDGWGEGFLLSSDTIDDHVFQRFKADVPLLPGRYLVKFSVDGEWRLAPDWPTEDTEAGDTNNVLIVEPHSIE